MTEEQKQTMIDTLYRGAKDFGIPTFILGVMLWFLRDGAIAAHRTVVEPIVKAHIEFLQATQDSLKASASSQERTVETMQELSTGQRDLQRLIGRMHGVPTDDGT